MRKFGGSKGYGFLPDPAGHQVTHAGRLLGGASPAPSHASVSECIQYLLNQGQTSACTGHAITGAIETYLASLDLKIPHLSPCSAYRNGVAIDRADDSIPLTDEGAQPNQVIRAASLYGIAVFGSAETDGSDPEAAPNVLHITDEPTIAELESADATKLFGAHAIPDNDPNWKVLMRQSIAVGIPFCFATAVNQQMEDWSGLGTIAPVINNVEGYHYIYCTEYVDQADGTTIFKGPNSWSKDWGQGGMWAASDTFMRATTNRLIMSISKTAIGLLRKGA